METSVDVVAELVHRLVASDWPTTEEERRRWFTVHGLDADGDPVADLDRRSPGTATFAGRGGGSGEILWSFYEGEFTDLGWFLQGADEDATRALAEGLRERFDASWPVEDRATDEIQGFTSLWLPEGRRVEMYFHAPRQWDNRAVPGSVQLHVSHAARAAAQESRAVAERGAGQGGPGSR